MIASGVGTSFTAEWRERLVPQFIDNLSRTRRSTGDRAPAALPGPDGVPTQAALWQVNWWSRVWRDDHVDPYPVITRGYDDMRAGSNIRGVIRF
jgi:hypothetical protein